MHTVDLTSSTFFNDPYSSYRQLQKMPEPYWLPHIQTNSSSQGLWLFSRYTDVINILKMSGPLSKQISRIRSQPDLSHLDNSMLNQDPPEHTRLRELAKKQFTTEGLQKLEVQITHFTDKLISTMCKKNSADFMTDFALQLPVMVITEIFGIHDEDTKKFRQWSNQIITGYDSAIANDEVLARQQSAMLEFNIYLKQLIEKRRRQPGNDFISELIEAQDQYKKLNQDEVLGMCVLILIAGYETSVNLLGNGLNTLLQHPEQFDLLRQQPEYLPTAIEEMLRFESPLQRSTFRITTEACELGGKQFRQGEQICAMIGAANRDPDQFTHPDDFDITRTPNKHVAFGQGIHACLGAALARTEARIAFGQILERLPNIKLTEKPPVWNPMTFFRGLRSFPVAY